MNTAALDAPRRKVVTAGTLKRMLAGNGGLVAALILFLLFALNFNAYRVFSDGKTYYSFVQLMFGDASTGSGYLFGTGLMQAPFYGLGKLVSATGLLPYSTDTITQGMIGLSGLALVLLAALGSGLLIKRLGLSACGFAVGVAVFGSPIWYYGSLEPSYSHPADAFAFTLVALCLWKAWTGSSDRWLAALAATLALTVAIRPYNAGLLLGCVVVLWLMKRKRDGLFVGVSSLIAYGILVSVPLLLGASLFKRIDGTVVGSATDSFTGGRQMFGFAPLSPLEMLFTPHRGLFVWTPITLLAVIGMVMLIRSLSSSPKRNYLIALTVMVGVVFLMHISLVWWDGAWSFSNRFLASFLPFYAIGIAGLFTVIRRSWRPYLAAAAVVGCLWSVWLGLAHAFGVAQSDGAFEIVNLYIKGEGGRSAQTFVDNTWSYSRVRHVVEDVF